MIYIVTLPHMTHGLGFDPIFKGSKVDSIYKYLELRILRLDHQLYSLSRSKSSEGISILTKIIGLVKLTEMQFHHYT